MRGFPRTAREFADQGRVVVVHCVGGCGHRATKDPETIMLTFGEDFDVVSGVAEISATLYCVVCASQRPNIYFVSATPAPTPSSIKERQAS